jgi:probable addiction module antidote protein
MRDISHDAAMAEMLRDDPAFATALLNDILKDGDASELLVALRQMTQAFGGVSAVALAADLNPTQLYRTLSKEGNPSIKSLSSVLRAMGLRLAVEPLVAA